MKKVVIVLVLFSLFTLFLFVKSYIISDTKPDECAIVTTTIVKIEEATSYDISFYNDEGDLYYINRGLEQGLNLDDLNTTVLNKTVTLHLPKLMFGVSGHIAQLAIDDEIIYTEFD